MISAEPFENEPQIKLFYVAIIFTTLTVHEASTSILSHPLRRASLRNHDHIHDMLGEEDEVLVCQSNAVCKDVLRCIDEKCRNPCHKKDCRSLNPLIHERVCVVEKHVPKCRFGPELQIPDLPDCQNDSDCGKNESCIALKCRNPCVGSVCSLFPGIKNSTGKGVCVVEDHFAVCRDSALLDPSDIPTVTGCSSDSDCTNDQQCMNGECGDPCLGHDCSPFNPLIRDVVCVVDNHLPFCEIFDPEDYPEIKDCKTNEDCNIDKQCIDSVCQDPCTRANCTWTHGRFEEGECIVKNHIAVCKLNPTEESRAPWPCPGNEYIRYYCRLDQQCINKRCVFPPCELDCPSNSTHTGKCIIEEHVPVCEYKSKPDADNIRACESNSECENWETCFRQKCSDMCEFFDCSKFYKEKMKDPTCYSYNHKPGCLPAERAQIYHDIRNGLPIRKACETDDVCDEDEQCRDSFCWDPCHRVNCSLSQSFTSQMEYPYCVVEKHIGICMPYALPYLHGKPCDSNKFCGSQEHCIEGKCHNPCYLGYCTPSSANNGTNVLGFVRCSIENQIPACKAKGESYCGEQMKKSMIGTVCRPRFPHKQLITVQSIQ